MDGACGMYRRQERCIQGFGGETSVKETIWKTQAWMRTALQWIFRKWDGNAWTLIDLAEDTDR
jgi:hypothetical protein